MARLCARPGCTAPATATITFDGLRRIVWISPLAEAAAYSAGDLCRRHAEQLGPPSQLGVARHPAPAGVHRAPRRSRRRAATWPRSRSAPHPPVRATRRPPARSARCSVSPARATSPTPRPSPPARCSPAPSATPADHSARHSSTPVLEAPLREDPAYDRRLPLARRDRAGRARPAAAT